MAHAPSLKFLALAASAYVCGVFTLLAPRPVFESANWALPVSGLRSVRTCTSASLAAGPAQLRDVLRQHNRAELGLSEPTTLSDARARSLRTLGRSVGAEGLADVRRVMLCDLQRALAGDLPHEDRAAVLGRFLDELARERIVTADGRLLLPMVLVELLYSIHINLALTLPMLDDLAPDQRLVYFGALALHLPGASPERRLWAAEQYAAEGGPHAADVLAQVALDSGDSERAAAMLQRVFADTGELRARNAAFWLARLR